MRQLVVHAGQFTFACTAEPLVPEPVAECARKIRIEEV